MLTNGVAMPQRAARQTTIGAADLAAGGTCSGDGTRRVARKQLFLTWQNSAPA